MKCIGSMELIQRIKQTGLRDALTMKQFWMLLNVEVTTKHLDYPTMRQMLHILLSSITVVRRFPRLQVLLALTVMKFVAVMVRQRQSDRDQLGHIPMSGSMPQ